jgi:Rrf2 family nitric oxide-sensitive transcriptional repressor
MRLTEYTAHTPPVLMPRAARPQQLMTIGELVDHHLASKNDLRKIVNDLAQGVLETTRGRGGAFRLTKAAKQIRVGDVVRACETDLRLVECFDPETNPYTLSPSCRLKGLFRDALTTCFKALDGMTLAELTTPAPSCTETGTQPSSPGPLLAQVRAPFGRRWATGKPKLFRPDQGPSPAFQPRTEHVTTPSASVARSHLPLTQAPKPK